MMIHLFLAVVALCALYVSYLAGKEIGKEDGFFEGRSEAYRELEHIIDYYKELARDAKDTATEGA